MTPLSPHQLVPLVQRTLPGDHRPFEQLIHQYKAFVFGTALRIMGNQEDAEDQTQEVFLKVYDEIKTLEQPATFNTWLARVTINTCLNALKRQRRLRSDSLEQALAHSQGITDTNVLLPESAALAGELRACLEEALAQLSDGERVILVLRDMEDCSYQEISTMLNIGLSAVKMRIHRTRLSFQGIFQRVCPDVWQHNGSGPEQVRTVGGIG